MFLLKHLNKTLLVPPRITHVRGTDGPDGRVKTVAEGDSLDLSCLVFGCKAPVLSVLTQACVRCSRSLCLLEGGDRGGARGEGGRGGAHHLPGHQAAPGELHLPCVQRMEQQHICVQDSPH